MKGLHNVAAKHGAVVAESEVTDRITLRARPARPYSASLRLPLVRHVRAAAYATLNGQQYRRWKAVHYLPWSERRFHRALRMIRSGHL